MFKNFCFTNRFEKFNTGCQNTLKHFCTIKPREYLESFYVHIITQLREDLDKLEAYKMKA